MKINSMPSSLDAEQSVLSSLILDSENLSEFLSVLKEEYFYYSHNKEIFRSILNLERKLIPVNLVSVVEDLKKNHSALDIEEIKQYLVDILETASGNNLDYYIEVIKAKADHRKIIRTLDAFLKTSYEEKSPPDELLTKIIDELYSILSSRESVTPEFSLLKDKLENAINQIEEIANSDRDFLGISTGYEKLDSLLSGLKKKDLIILAGRPSMGKSTLALNIAENVSNNNGYVGFISIEMGEDQITMRSIASTGRIPLTNLLNGKMEEGDWKKLNYSVSKIVDSRIFIYQPQNPTLDHIISIIKKMDLKARSLQKEQSEEEIGLSLVVLDYIQLIYGNASDNGARSIELAKISRALKEAAIQTDTPFLVLSQLNRGLESRPNKRPMMSDLRESGALEQDADVVMFIYRDEVYNAQSEYQNIAEIIIGKQRNGPLGTVSLIFNGSITRFENYINPYE